MNTLLDDFRKGNYRPWVESNKLFAINLLEVLISTSYPMSEEDIKYFFGFGIKINKTYFFSYGIKNCTIGVKMCEYGNYQSLESLLRLGAAYPTLDKISFKNNMIQGALIGLINEYYDKEKIINSFRIIDEYGIHPKQIGASVYVLSCNKICGKSDYLDNFIKTCTLTHDHPLNCYMLGLSTR